MCLPPDFWAEGTAPGPGLRRAGMSQNPFRIYSHNNLGGPAPGGTDEHILFRCLGGQGCSGPWFGGVESDYEVTSRSAAGPVLVNLPQAHG